MKNALDGIICRITVAEEWMSDLKDRMVEKSLMEQNEEKRIKEMRTVSETSGSTLNAPTFEL